MMSETTPQTVLLLTRPERQAKRFQAICAERLGFRPRTIFAPMMQIRPRLQFVLPPANETLIVSSENALDALFQRADMTGRKAFCVGRATTKSAQGYGLAAEYAGRTASELVDFLISLREPGPFAHARGVVSTGDIAARLTQAGLPTSEYVVYEQNALPLSDGARAILAIDRRIILPLFSPRSARLFFDAEPEVKAQLRTIALSQAVADEIPPWANTILANDPCAASVADCVARVFEHD